MKAVWLVTKKNVKLLLRAKGSALIVIFAPLLIVLILGLSYNTSSQFGLSIGVYAPSYTDDVNSFVTLLEEDAFTIQKYDSSLDDCIEDIKMGQVHTCISLPESLSVEDNTPREITFYVDPSRLNLVWMVQETVQGKFDIKSQEISEGLTQNILTKVAQTQTTITETSGTLSSVRSEAAAVSGVTASVRSDLAVLDLGGSTADFGSEILKNLTEELDSAKESVDKSLERLEEANMSASDKNVLRRYLTEASESLAATDEIDDNGTSTSAKSVFAGLIDELNVTRTKLSKASTAIAGATPALASSGTTLEQIQSSLDSVLASLNDISATLSAQKVTEAGTIVSPLTTIIEPVQEEGTYLNYLFPAILVLVVMFSSLLLGTTLVMMEKNSPAFLRNFFLPIRKMTFIISVYMTNVILIIIQLLVILGISLFFLTDTLPQFPNLALVLFIAASVFTFLGMAIGYFFVSEETGILASISLGNIFLFFSGLILPLEGLSPTLRSIAQYSPFVIAKNLIREVFLFSSPLQAVWVDLVIFVGYAVVLFVIILILESIMHKHLVHKFLRHHHRAHIQRDKMNKGRA